MARPSTRRSASTCWNTPGSADPVRLARPRSIGDGNSERPRGNLPGAFRVSGPATTVPCHLLPHAPAIPGQIPPRYPRPHTPSSSRPHAPHHPRPHTLSSSRPQRSGEPGSPGRAPGRPGDLQQWRSRITAARFPGCRGRGVFMVIGECRQGVPNDPSPAPESGFCVRFMSSVVQPPWPFLLFSCASWLTMESGPQTKKAPPERGFRAWPWPAVISRSRRSPSTARTSGCPR